MWKIKDRIKEVRVAANLTQLEFAEKLSLTRNYIAQVEIGAKEPSDRTIRDICREFNVSETWLRTGAGEMKAAVSREQEMATYTKNLLQRPESFRNALITTLLRFDPDGSEWKVLEDIYNGISEAQEKQKEP